MRIKEKIAPKKLGVKIIPNISDITSLASFLKNKRPNPIKTQ